MITSERYADQHFAADGPNRSARFVLLLKRGVAAFAFLGQMPAHI